MSHTITNRATGNEFQADANETVLEAALRQGHMLPYSCRTGSCGSCKGVIIQGGYDGGIGEHDCLTPAELSRGVRLLCQTRPLADLQIDVSEVNAPAGVQIRNLPCRVIDKETLCHDVMQLTLALPKSQPFQFLAGQYIDIVLRDGRRRSFSIATTPTDEHLHLHIRRVQGGHFSEQVFTTLKARSLLRMEGPFGTFFLREDDTTPAIFIAGGTGFAPIKAMIDDALQRGLNRPMHVFWGVRAERDLYADQHAKDWAHNHPHIDYTAVLSEPDDHTTWQGSTGWVHDAVLAHYPDLSGKEVYAAGPPPMIQACQQAFPAAGLHLDHLYFDSFEYAPA